MDLSTQIKQHRTNMQLSQEQLGEKVYVTRQTISNWENNKSYPDIHSLLLLSTLFNVSLDQLIKGDITKMRDEISKSEIKRFHYYGTIFMFLLLITVLSAVPIITFFGYYGLLASVALLSVTMYFAYKVEKLKRENNVQTYKEIVAFTEGKRLDELEMNQEAGKRPYQKAFLMLTTATITLIICLSLTWLLK